MANKVPASEKANTPQKVLKSIQPVEIITMNIVKKVTGEELEKMLQGITAFTKCIGAEDQYEVSIKVAKLIETEQDIEGA